MAAKRLFCESDFSCPYCLDVFKDPVIMECSHSVCKACAEKYWATKGCQECPVCRKRFFNSKLQSNLVLRNLCENILAQQRMSVASELLCSLHSEKLKLFCLEDKQPVCVVCQTSKLHRGHNLSPIDEAAADMKEELKNKLEPLKERLKTFEKAKLVFNQTAAYILTQVQCTEKQIKEEFEKLHQFLRNEETSRISALREEEKQKSQMMKEKIEKMSRESSFISDTIRAIEREMTMDDLTFLQSYKSTVARAQCTLKDPERLSGALINEAKHLGNLEFLVWEKMQEIVQYTPVTLDPNTANPSLILSEDLSSLRRGDEIQHLPDNPERFDFAASVLGSEAFNSGTHCWDVEVRENTGWSVGVMTESLQRKGDFNSKSGLWFIVCSSDRYWAWSTPQTATELRVQQRPQVIRVQLDFGKGHLTFSDPDNSTLLCTFIHTFTEKVLPYFNTGEFPLCVLPVKSSVTLEPLNLI
ncbi:zinc-binding protein A33-like [Engraulis encrasicolus]|uniref:zinc-binding protein A33-like n=1 Tax=Engraulis encrasicolus TaxID=184585 RepID=UPI002FD07833